MIPEPPPIPAASFKDRNTGLVVFGILTILIGVSCALFVPLIFLAQSAAARSAQPGLPTANILPAIAMFGCMAVIFIWLGIGSTLARRWARALLLVFAWSWLLLGGISLIMLLVMLPRMLASINTVQSGNQTVELPAGAKVIMMAIPVVMMTATYVVLPAIWVLFYGRKDVKRTCEVRDPKPRWTDRCPLPVLGVSLWLWLGALMMLVIPFAFHGVFPLFGTILVGWAGTILYITLAVLWIYAAWALYRLDRKGWWVLFVAMIAISISTFLTYSRHDVTEIYRIAGYSEAQLDQLEKANVFAGAHMAWISLIFAVPFLVYLLYIRRYLRRDSAPARRGAV
jgi:MFS family permease